MNYIGAGYNPLRLLPSLPLEERRKNRLGSLKRNLTKTKYYFGLASEPLKIVILARSGGVALVNCSDPRPVPCT